MAIKQNAATLAKVSVFIKLLNYVCILSGDTPLRELPLTDFQKRIIALADRGLVNVSLETKGPLNLIHATPQERDLLQHFISETTAREYQSEPNAAPTMGYLRLEDASTGRFLCRVKMPIRAMAALMHKEPPTHLLSEEERAELAQVCGTSSQKLQKSMNVTMAPNLNSYLEQLAQNEKPLHVITGSSPDLDRLHGEIAGSPLPRFLG